MEIGQFQKTLPSDEMLVAIGKVAVRAGQLEYGLRLAIKSLLGLPIEEMSQQTDGVKAADLRKKIMKAAKWKFGDGPTFRRISDLMKDAWRAADDRNAIVHDAWGSATDTGAPLHYADGAMRDSPTVAQVEAIAARLDQIAENLNHARLHGWIKAAIEAEARLHGGGTVTHL